MRQQLILLSTAKLSAAYQQAFLARWEQDGSPFTHHATSVGKHRYGKARIEALTFEYRIKKEEAL